MKNINNLIHHSDFSLEMQTRLYELIANISDEIEVNNNHYEECKKLFLEADAILNKAIAEDDYEATQDAAQAIIQIVNEFHEARERIIQLTSKKKSFYKMLMNRQKKDEHCDGEKHVDGDKHIYVLPRQQAFELLKALTEGIKANTDFKTVTLAIATSFLKK